VLSTVTEADLLVQPYRDDQKEAIETIADLLSEDGIEVIAVDRRIARRAARLRAARPALRLPDAAIIATGLETRCDLIVGNDQLWSRLDGLEVPYIYLDSIIKK
jgi:hypothetical protein